MLNFKSITLLVNIHSLGREVLLILHIKIIFGQIIKNIQNLKKSKI